MSKEKAPYTVRVEGDLIQALKPMLIYGSGVAIIVICIGWVLLMMPKRGVVEAGIQGQAPREIQMIEQTLIRYDHSTERLKAEQEKQLGQYGWVDREKGVVHIPIDQAMQMIVEQHR